MKGQKMNFTEPNEELIQKTTETWSKEYGYIISREDPIGIIHNLRSFAEVLIDMYLAEKHKAEK